MDSEQPPVNLQPSTPTHSQVSIWELLVVLSLVVLVDICLYRSGGYSGWAMFLFFAPVLLGTAAWRPRTHHRSSLYCVALLLVFLTLRLTWFGSALLVVCGMTLLLCMSVSLRGHTPTAQRALGIAVISPVSGITALDPYVRTLGRFIPVIIRAKWMNIALPAGAVILFGGIFILANPELAESFGANFRYLVDKALDWLSVVEFSEMIVWMITILIAGGLLHPIINLEILRISSGREPDEQSVDPAILPALRNTLISLTALYAVYLVFEFKTLWFRSFPEGFYYAGYAHQGAAWLTVALALATIVFSAIFSGSRLRAPRIGSLRRWAWVWSAQNILLSFAVYNRLLIYVGFNGMTRLRIVAFFGVTVVVIGFVLVIVKVARSRSFDWLIQRQMWALGVTVYAYAMSPIDFMAVSYNTGRILRGDSSACMQLGTHTIDTEGALGLPRLLNCTDRDIRAGVRALMAEHYVAAIASLDDRRDLGWGNYQLIHVNLIDRFTPYRAEFKKYEDSLERETALTLFHEFAYQWY